MTTLKKVIGYAFVLIYTATAAASMAAAFGWLQVREYGLLGIFALGITQTAALITTLIKAPNYFDDPPAVTRLQEKHEEQKRESLEVTTRMENQYLRTIAELKDAEASANRAALEQKQKWVNEQNRKDS